MSTCIALLRGVNVGKARRVPMADLRALFESLGHGAVRTLLNSGNVVFDVKRADTARLAGALRQAIAERFGFDAPLIVVTAREFDAAVAGNPLAEPSRDPSRLLVGFFSSDAARNQAAPLAERHWAPDAFALGAQAAYLWCEAGVIDSPLSQAFARATGTSATTRNWATVLKLQALAGGSS